jgi:hypothetical protein
MAVTDYRSLFQDDTSSPVKSGESSLGLLELTGGNYRVGIGRWFGSDESGHILKSVSEINLSEPRFVVLCDFNAKPLVMNGALFILSVARLKKRKPVNKSQVSIRERMIYLSADASFKLDGEGLSLDRPANDERNEEVLAHTLRTEDGHLLPAWYLCEDGSQRATVKIYPDGHLEFIALVGARYTVLQNEILAEDAFELLKRSEVLSSTGLVESNSATRFAIGRALEAFYGLSVGFESSPSEVHLKSRELSIELVLFHSHDRSFTYTNAFVLRDVLVESQPILALGKVKIKHTKNVGDRVARVSSSLGLLEEGVTIFLQKKAILESCLIEERGDELYKFVLQHFDTDGRDWLVKKIIEAFESEQYSGTYGRNYWTLFRSICATEGGYWDWKTENSGLPALLEISDAYQRRNRAMESLLRGAAAN